ncbi:MAG: YesL family protein, partial [Ruminococcus sp.]
MTKIGIIICANLMFILFSLPFVTIGASYAALYRVMFKTMRSGGVTNPFKQFWLGFKTSFLQATIVWVIYAALMVFGYFDVQICLSAGEPISYFQYGLYALALIITLILIYTFPSIAAFEGKISAHFRNAIYFAFHKPWWIPVNLFFHIFPLYLT